MRELPAGSIGTVDVRLAPSTGSTERYQRKYVPVTPVSREIVGSDDKVAPDSTVAEWHIDDWSGGEGDLRWRDRGRYNLSVGMGPVSDGSGLAANSEYEQLNGTGGATVMTDARIITRGLGKLLTADDMAGTLFAFNDSTSEWDVSWTIGGTGTDNIVSIAAVDSTSVFVANSSGNIREVQSAASAAHYSGWTGDPLLVSYQGSLYGLEDNDLYDIDTSATGTRTLKVDVTGSHDRSAFAVKRLTTSDVGPVWVAPVNDGRTYLYEYNVADDTGYVVGELPKDVYPYDVWFHSGIYFVAFRYAVDGSTSGDAWLYYQVGGQRGVAGPFRSLTGVTSAKPIVLAGTIGDRLFVYYDTAIWAYDLSSGGISMVARNVDEPTSIVAYGPDLITATGTTSYRVNLAAFDTDTAAYLETGRYDFGYLGLEKTLTRVTVTCEDGLVSGDQIGVAYQVDGGTWTTLSGAMDTGDTTKTWIVSTNAATVRGVEFEFRLSVLARSPSASSKIVSMTSEAVGSESRLEWILLVDVGDSNEQRGVTVVDGLKALKAAHQVVEFIDPWQVLPSQDDEAFDVTVEEVNLPDIKAGTVAVAVVRLRSVATV